jgi:predicted AlkP superfamily pyrophosphatase or phosphodiesterase
MKGRVIAPRRCLLSFLLMLCVAVPAPAQTRPPRLLVIVVVDQLSREYLDRFGGHFSSGGFRRMLEKGADYPLCHHQHLATLTGPGHASLLTGAYPVHTGIIGNKWYSRQRDTVVECVGDERYPLLDDLGTGSDPAGTPGVSPLALRTSTVGDVLRVETGMRAKVVSLAIKDRAAVLLGGWRPNGAYWYDPGTCRFTTSTYYLQRLPEWLMRFNASQPCSSYVGQSWTKLLPDVDYTEIAAADDLPYERPSYGLGVTFPHRIDELAEDPKNGASPFRYATVIASPFGNDLLLRLARAAVEGEQLGADETPDVLTLGLSSNDYVGHLYGPQSQEVADMTLRTDRQIADLMQYLDRQVGSDAWTMLLTSDHGVAPIPEHLEHLGTLPARDDHYRLKVDTTRSNVDQALRQRFFTAGKAPADFPGFFEAWNDATFPFVYLSRAALAKLPGNVSFEDLQAIVAAEIEKVDGVAAVYTRSQREGLGQNADIFAQRAYRAWDEERGGDLLIRLHPYWLPLSERFATTHGAPYSYDTQVPMLLVGAGIQPGRYLRSVEAIDVASTVASLLRVSPPPSDQGRPLAEALR